MSAETPSPPRSPPRSPPPSSHDVLSFDDATGRVSPARFTPSPNCDSRPDDARIEVLVIHAISLPPGRYGGDAIERLFTNRLDDADDDAHPCFAALRELRVSAHFLIRRDGELVQFVPTHLRAWHAGESSYRGRARVNDFSLGVELEGCDEDTFEPPQYRELARLARCLLAHCPALSPQRIVGHSDIAPGRKT
ncbi:MAG: 1,6-anhydro-N-acetylmuramyl-L-alanine amidase AmpD, partial [bacterium]